MSRYSRGNRIPSGSRWVSTSAMNAWRRAPYITGWRVKSEILTRQRSHLDLDAGWIRLEPGETKNGKGRMFPLTPRLRAVLEAQLALDPGRGDPGPDRSSRGSSIATDTKS